MRRAYYATISYVDSMIGQALDILDEMGVANDTVVVVRQQPRLFVDGFQTRKGRKRVGFLDRYSCSLFSHADYICSTRSLEITAGNSANLTCKVEIQVVSLVHPSPLILA